MLRNTQQAINSTRKLLEYEKKLKITKNSGTRSKSPINKTAASKFEHLVMHVHFWSRDKDGSHNIQSTIAKTHATCKLLGSMIYRSGVIANGSFTLRK